MGVGQLLLKAMAHVISLLEISKYDVFEKKKMVSIITEAETADVSIMQHKTVTKGPHLQVRKTVLIVTLGFQQSWRSPKASNPF